MVASRWRRSFAVALALLAVGASAQAEDALQAELTWLLASGDASLDVERLSSRRSGRENTLRFSALSEQAGYVPGVRSAARLALDLELGEPDASLGQLRDASSSVFIAWQRGEFELGLRAYPLDSDAWRLGYLHALDWGGTDAARRESIFVDQPGGAPGALVEARWPKAYVFAGVKWARASSSAPRPGERSWGFLAGGSLELGQGLRLDAGFGAFERPPSRFVEGGSLRAVWQRGVREPELVAEPFRPPSLREEPLFVAREAGQGAAVAIEGTALLQRTEAATTPSTRWSLAPAAALYGSLQGATLGLHGALAWRSLAWLQRNSQGLSAVERGATVVTRAELAGWLGGNVRLPARVTPGLELGLLLPATLQSPSPLPGFVQTFVVRENGAITALPIGSDRVPIFAARLALRWDASSALLLALFATYERDANRARFSDTSEGLVRVFDRPDRFEAALAARATY